MSAPCFLVPGRVDERGRIASASLTAFSDAAYPYDQELVELADAALDVLQTLFRTEPP